MSDNSSQWYFYFEKSLPVISFFTAFSFVSAVCFEHGYFSVIGPGFSKFTIAWDYFFTSIMLIPIFISVTAMEILIFLYIGTFLTTHFDKIENIIKKKKSEGKTNVLFYFVIFAYIFIILIQNIVIFIKFPNNSVIFYYSNFTGLLVLFFILLITRLRKIGISLSRKIVMFGTITPLTLFMFFSMGIVVAKNDLKSTRVTAVTKGGEVYKLIRPISNGVILYTYNKMIFMTWTNVDSIQINAKIYAPSKNPICYLLSSYCGEAFDGDNLMSGAF